MNPLIAIGIYLGHRLIYWTSHPYLDQNELYTILKKCSKKLYENKKCDEVYFKGFSVRSGKLGNFNYMLMSSEASEKFNSMILRQLITILEKHVDTINIAAMTAIDKLIKSESIVIEQKTVFINDQIEPNRLFDTEELNKLDAILGKPEISLDTELLNQMYRKVTYDILKDESDLIEQRYTEQLRRTASSKTIDNSSIITTKCNALSTISIKPSMHKEKAMKVKIGHSELETQNEAAFNPFAKPVPKILIKEKMEIVVRGVQIQSKSVGGAISIDNITKSVDYYFEMENDYWFNRDVINHKLNDYLPNTVNLIQEPEGIFFSISNQHSSHGIILYEYKINAKLIDMDTVPFVIAFKHQIGQLAIKITLNPSHKANIINFQLKIEFSEYQDPNEITSSHMGTVIGKYYLIIFEQEELAPDSIVVQLSYKNRGTRCVSVKAMSSLSASFASLLPNLTNLSLKSTRCDRVTVLDVEYLLIIN